MSGRLRVAEAQVRPHRPRLVVGELQQVGHRPALDVRGAQEVPDGELPPGEEPFELEVRDPHRESCRTQSVRARIDPPYDRMGSIRIRYQSPPAAVTRLASLCRFAWRGRLIHERPDFAARTWHRQVGVCHVTVVDRERHIHDATLMSPIVFVYTRSNRPCLVVERVVVPRPSASGPAPSRPGGVSVKARKPSCASSVWRCVAMTRAVCHFDDPWGRPRTSRTIDLAARAAVGPAASRSPIARGDGCVEGRLALHDLVDQPDPLGPQRVEPAAAGEQGAGVGLADLRDDERADHRRQDPEPRLGEPEPGPALGDDEVGSPRTAPSRRRAPPRGPGRSPAPGRYRSSRTSRPSPSRPARCASRSSAIAARIQAMSAPAQKLGPAPARTTARSSTAASFGERERTRPGARR